MYIAFVMLIARYLLLIFLENPLFSKFCLICIIRKLHTAYYTDKRARILHQTHKQNLNNPFECLNLNEFAVKNLFLSNF